MWQRLRSERGASAVEFAFIVPLLILLAVGIAEFGRAFQVQGTLSAAAREGVRAMALQNDQAAARTMVRSVAASLNPGITDGEITITPASCPVTYTSGASVSLTIRYRLPLLSDLFGAGLDMQASGTMRCNG
jgi:Flp pilus assembly protein TadG